MEDLASALANVLNDPESMKMLSSLASSLPGMQSTDGQQGTANSGIVHQETASPDSTPAGQKTPVLSLPGLPGEEMAMLMKIGSLLQSGQEDDRTRLLQALRPLLTPPRQARVDKAIRLLRLAELLPLLKDAGFSLF